jgi:regulator of nucleoside diphosphate kinase
MKISLLDNDRLNDWIARIRVNWIDGEQIAMIVEDRIRTAEISDPLMLPDDTVTMNSLIMLRDQDGGHIRVHRLVYPDVADESAGCISVFSVFGASLLGSRVGDIVDQRTPSGIRRRQIASVPYQPEREHALHL